jgi:hypothetical protein
MYTALRDAWIELANELEVAERIGRVAPSLNQTNDS